MSKLDEKIKGKLTYSLCGKWYEVYGTLIEKKGNYFELLKENGKKIIGSCSDWIFEGELSKKMTVYELIKSSESNCANTIFNYICINFLKVNGISVENEYVLDELTKISSFLEEELTEKEIEILHKGDII